MAIHEVHVSRKKEFGDPRGEDVAAEAKRVLGIDTTVKTTRIYRFEGPNESQVRTLADKAFADPIVETGIIDPDVTRIGGSPNIEVAYRPEVTDPVSGSVKKVGMDLGIPIDEAKVSTRYEFEGISQDEADQIAQKILINQTVQEPIFEPPTALKLIAREWRYHVTPTMRASDEELMRIDYELETSLSLPKLKAIQSESRRIERDFTEEEIQHIGGAWSEHCVHESFDATIIKDGVEKPSFFSRIKESSRRHFEDKVATAFDDNAGGIYFYDGQVILVKWETHNSPSALEPKGGAATGSGGVFRDIMGTGQGAKVIMSTDVFMTGPTDMDPKILPEGCIPPDILLRGVVAGVRDYGNPMGVPTMNGSVYTHEDFRAKPTILVGAYGITPEQYAKKGEPQVGDRVVVIGGRTGRDGIHGANFSSIEMNPDTVLIYGAAVQIGNPIEEKKIADLILEARDAGFIRAITDCGASGFGSAIGEIGEKTGVNVDISDAPLKYAGMTPWEIWMSESQERMILAISPENIEEFKKLSKRFNVEATDLGYFDGSSRLQVTHKGYKMIDLEYDFIKNGRPKKTLVAKFEKPIFPEPEIPEPQTSQEWIEKFKQVLADDNVCSKLPIVEQYDTTVQGRSVVGPFAGVNFDAPNDAAIIRPILGKPYGMIVSHGTNPILNRIDPRRGAIWAATEAVANLVAAGGDYQDAGLCGNYITPVLDNHHSGAVDIMVDAMSEFEDALGIPVISGKDSVSSTYSYSDGSKLHIPIVLNVATIGKMPDVAYKMTTSFKKPGSAIVLVGKMHPGMAGSTYYKIHNVIGNEVPEVNLNVLPDVLGAVHDGILSRDIRACHDVSEGGVAGAIAEMCFGGNCGVDLVLDKETHPDFFLFNETAGMFIVEVESVEKVRELFGEIPHVIIGKTVDDKKIRVQNNGQELFSADVGELKEAWQEPMSKLFH